MSDDIIRKAIEELQTKLAPKLEEVRKAQRLINGMAATIGDPPIYPDVDDPQAVTRKPAGIRPDEFFGRSPITAAREFLEKSGSPEPKTAEEILDAFITGGFDFAAYDWKPENRLRNLSISLSKNTGVFVRLPSGPFGLVKWYPELKAKKTKPDTGNRETKSATSTAPGDIAAPADAVDAPADAGAVDAAAEAKDE